MRGRGPGGVDAALAVAAPLARSSAPASVSFTPAIQFATLGWVGVIALYDLSRHAWAGTWTRFQPLEHGLKMTGVYVAMALAGAGNLLRGLSRCLAFPSSLYDLVVEIFEPPIDRCFAWWPDLLSCREAGVQLNRRSLGAVRRLLIILRLIHPPPFSMGRTSWPPLI